jgi:hypothetical protein
VARDHEEPALGRFHGCGPRCESGPRCGAVNWVGWCLPSPFLRVVMINEHEHAWNGRVA